MSTLELIHTMPGKENYLLFSELPKKLYPEDSPRFILGHDCATTHLKGCYVLKNEHSALGRFAFYVNPHLQFNGLNTCCIGSFECIDDKDVCTELLNHACNIAREKGFKYVIGPMEGSTWNSYRFSDHNNSDNFFMEPYHHVYYNDLFKAYGFESISNYISKLDRKPHFNPEYILRTEQQIHSLNGTLRTLDMNNLETELVKIAQFNNEAFQNNFLFTPISEYDFVKKYIQFKNYFDPELIWIVEDEQNRIQALSFSIPDYLDPTGKTVIIKSLARLKNTPFVGIGNFLVDKTYQVASQRGFENIIHALMIQDNSSVKISNSHASDHYKSYSLYGYAL